MKKKMYETPDVLVVRLSTNCAILQTSGGENSGSVPGSGGGEDPGVRSWEFQDDSEW